MDQVGAHGQEDVHAAAAAIDMCLHMIRRDHGADLILHGTFQRQGDTIRITYAVVNPVTRQSAAAGTLDGSASDLFLLQDRLAENVSQAAGSPLSRPALNQRARCSDVPCVNESGTT